MLGYGRPHHKVKDIETPIFARAIVIQQEGKYIAFVNAEIGFCTIYLKHGVLLKLKEKYPDLPFQDNNVMITAQHTHSAAGGFDQHFFYNVPTPGFSEYTWNKYRTCITDAIALAYYKRKKAKLQFGEGYFKEDEEVAFNRSIDAYNANPDVKEKLPQEKWHLAADRDMKLISFVDEENENIATLNWFGTHCTSVSNDMKKICSDNKGYAATIQENHYYNKYKKEKTVCIFAQDACGDISPNFIYDKRKKWTRGKYKDDYESAQYTGNLQAQKAISIDESKKKNIGQDLEYIQTYVDFSDIQCSSEFTNGNPKAFTSPACLGVSFLEGTVEGPGMAKPLANILRKAVEIHRNNEYRFAKQRTQEYADYVHTKYDAQGPKHIVIEAGRGKMAWHEDLTKLPIPGFLEKSLDYIRNAAKQRKTTHKPWIISRLPLQIFIIGELAIVGMPTEITTVAGRRLRKTLLDVLQSKNVKQVILSPYANAYAGYVTTREEYLLQKYEGGHTLFGQWTLAAMQTELQKLALKLVNNEEDHSQALIFDREQIWEFKK